MEENLSTNPYTSKGTLSTALKTVLLIVGGFLSYSLGIWIFYRLLPALTLPELAVDSKVFWYIIRASGIIAYVFLWISMLLGLLMTTRLIPKGFSSQASNEIHKFVSLFGLGFIFLHAIMLVWDEFMQTTIWQLFIPFTVFNYKPLSVGAGQIASYLWLVIILSHYVRKHIGRQAWRIIHYLSFGAFWLVLLHGITAGTDTGTSGMTLLYWSSAGSMVFLTIYRILSAIFAEK